MSGAASALPEMIENMNHGGRIAMLGLPSAPIAIDWGKVVTHMLTIKGIYGREMFETWNAMGAMLRTSGRCAPDRVDRHATGSRRAMGAAFAAAAAGGVRQGHPRLDRALGTREHGL